MKLVGYICDVCGEKDGIQDRNYPESVNRLIMHIERGWYIEPGMCYCPDCIPQNLRIRENRKPIRTVFKSDLYAHVEERYEDERYDPYFQSPNLGDICRACKWHHWESEVDGTYFETCKSGDKKHWGHNLYDGHFYGSAVKGRLCHYFTFATPDNRVVYNPSGRDPWDELDRGIYEPPYNQEYDYD